MPRARCLSAESLGYGVACQRRRENRVDDEPLVADPQGCKLPAGTSRFGECALVGTRDEYDGGPPRIGEDRSRRGELLVLRFETGQRTQAARAGRARFEVAAPYTRQTQQAQGMAGRRGVEEDVIERRGQLGVGHEARELVERGDLDRALTGQLLLEGAQLLLRHDSARRREGPLRYLPAAASGSMFCAHSRSAPGTGVGSRPIDAANTSSRLEAGSVLTTSTRRP